MDRTAKVIGAPVVLILTFLALLAAGILFYFFYHKQVKKIKVSVTDGCGYYVSE